LPPFGPIDESRKLLSSIEVFDCAVRRYLGRQTGEADGMKKTAFFRAEAGIVQ
jgi:hypothetical protein